MTKAATSAQVVLLLLAATTAVAAAMPSDAAEQLTAPPQQLKDQIHSLPGLSEELGFKMYSGYLDVDPAHGRTLFYWFFESQAAPSTDPMLLWLQGGPGCSSLIGAFLENGPLRVTEDGNLEVSGFSWNRFANLLYLESPAGVGFSYSNTSSDYNANNTLTANDNYHALGLWQQRFPQYASNEWWIAGESYGGDYVPQLVHNVLHGTNAGLKDKLKGFIIGNPTLSCPEWEATANDLEVSIFFFHALIPRSAYMDWQASGCAGSQSTSPACTAKFNTIQDMIGPFDPDNNWTDLKSGNASLGLGPVLKTTITNRMNLYLNRPDVQTAIHAVPRNWVACCAEPGQTGTKCKLNYTTPWPNMLPYYQSFFDIAPQLDILIYSGDTDIATCPHVYAQLCLSALGVPLKSKWRPWTMDGQTTGYVEVYEDSKTGSGYTYATVKGAGHEVPMFQPAQAYHLVSNFVGGKQP